MVTEYYSENNQGLPLTWFDYLLTLFRLSSDIILDHMSSRVLIVTRTFYKRP